ncbi:hypothetical protein LOTGIDRAFT_155371 [Lottia gigantea]|uniref:Uncharacterized protein n=1 Tax=Lottia gigantea TaxID=225164 RepID=V3ZIK9_LOTGI|nr:hypothetical protein LOTGIDRAFT_155371 [Lottia gigantea]ESO84057.1 hypothetical protein LOTGIDRAFT_155371 [Lottia gigantea]
MAEIQVSQEPLKEKLRPSRSSVTGSSTKGGRKKGLNSDSPKQIDNTTNSLPGCSTGNNNNSSTSVFKSNIFASSKSKDGPSVEPSNSDVMSILKAIQENQTAQNSRFDKLSSKVDELYNNDNYDDYDENELLGYNDEEYCDDDLDVLPAKKAKISSDMELSDYIFAQAGKKLKVKDLCDVPINQDIFDK